MPMADRVRPLRILFLSNSYPPIRSGGYDQLCHDVAGALRVRGHDVAVLTSREECATAVREPGGVYRYLQRQNDLFFYRPAYFFLGRKTRERQNQRALEQVVAEVQPDLLMVWGMWGMSHRILSVAERMFPARIVYYLADYWPISDDLDRAYWKLPTRRPFMRPVKEVLRRIARRQIGADQARSLRFDHVLCVSEALKRHMIDGGLQIEHAQVIHNGIDVDDFLIEDAATRHRSQQDTLRLLYAGQVAPHKGVFTLVEALARLAEADQISRLTLTIIGTGHPDNMTRMETLIRTRGLTDRVILRAAVPREAMPAVLREHDVLLFPSIYEEPLARIVQEAMLVGLAVIGTTTGGTKEILVDRENGLTFEPDDAEGLAAQIARLVADPGERDRLVAAGRRTILDHFTLDRMADEVEAYLQRMLCAP